MKKSKTKSNHAEEIGSNKREHHYSESESAYIFSLISKKTYLEICSKDEYLPNGLLITPLSYARDLDIGREKMRMRMKEKLEYLIKNKFSHYPEIHNSTKRGIYLYAELLCERQSSIHNLKWTKQEEIAFQEITKLKSSFKKLLDKEHEARVFSTFIKPSSLPS